MGESKAMNWLSLWIVMTLVVLPNTLLRGEASGANSVHGTAPDIAESIQHAISILNRFFKCHETEEYERCYDLFSSRYKKALKEESGITDRDEYRKMTFYRGLKWHSPEISKKMLSNHNKIVVFIVRMTFEQHIFGERVATDRVNTIFEVVKEAGKWVIDDWKFS